MKNIIITLLAMGFIGVCYSQKEPKNSVRDARKAFIEERLQLTEDEKQKFWPVADEYLFKERELRMNFGLKMDFIPENLSDKQAEEYFKLIAKFHQDEYELFKTYSEKIKSIIGVNKTVRFYALRQEFKKEMVKRAGGRPPKHPKNH
jgi:hypothetical protein